MFVPAGPRHPGLVRCPNPGMGSNLCISPCREPTLMPDRCARQSLASPSLIKGSARNRAGSVTTPVNPRMAEAWLPPWLIPVAGLGCSLCGAGFRTGAKGCEPHSQAVGERDQGVGAGTGSQDSGFCAGLWEGTCDQGVRAGTRNQDSWVLRWALPLPWGGASAQIT